MKSLLARLAAAVAGAFLLASAAPAFADCGHDCANCPKKSAVEKGTAEAQKPGTEKPKECECKKGKDCACSKDGCKCGHAAPKPA